MLLLWLPLDALPHSIKIAYSPWTVVVLLFVHSWRQQRAGKKEAKRKVVWFALIYSWNDRTLCAEMFNCARDSDSVFHPLLWGEKDEWILWLELSLAVCQLSGFSMCEKRWVFAVVSEEKVSKLVRGLAYTLSVSFSHYSIMNIVCRWEYPNMSTHNANAIQINHKSFDRWGRAK